MGTVHKRLQEKLAGGSSEGHRPSGSSPTGAEKAQPQQQVLLGSGGIRRVILGKQTVLAVPHQPQRSSSFAEHLGQHPSEWRLRLSVAYLAVRGADRKPNIGGDHHGEGRGQLDSEATVGENRKTTSQERFVWPG